jgi:hypothetical protein
MLYKNIWDLSIALWENICFQNRKNKGLTYGMEWDILAVSNERRTQ